MTPTLANVPFGQTVHIVSVGGERGFRRRLMELGFLPGTSVVVRAVAPMGDPLDVSVRGCRFSLRRAEADYVEVSAALPELAAK